MSDVVIMVKMDGKLRALGAVNYVVFLNGTKKLALFEKRIEISPTRQLMYPSIVTKVKVTKF
jgi:hypothetical protein